MVGWGRLGIRVCGFIIGLRRRGEKVGKEGEGVGR